MIGPRASVARPCRIALHRKMGGICLRQASGRRFRMRPREMIHAGRYNEALGEKRS